jgi:hypothetical protein
MREKVRSASGRRRPAIGTHDELLELGIQPLELPLEEVDDKALVALLGVNEEALAASHDANNLPEQKRESSASMATRRGGGNSTNIMSRWRAPSIQALSSGARKPKMRSIDERMSCWTGWLTPRAASRLACRRT